MKPAHLVLRARGCATAYAALAVAFTGVSSAAPRAPAGPPATVPAVHFFRQPLITEAVVSPSGRYVAAVLKSEGDDPRRLVVLDMNDLNQSRALASFSDSDIARVRWVNDDRLVFGARDSREPLAKRRPSGLFVAGREGKGPAERLISRRWDKTSVGSNIKQRQLSPDYFFFSTVRDGSDDVLVAKTTWSSSGQPLAVNLYRMDTRSLQLRSVSEDAPEGAMWWAIDYKGVPHALVTSKEGKSGLYWRAGAEGPWTLIQQYASFNSKALNAPTPLWMTSGTQMLASGKAGATDDADSLLRLTLRDGVPQAETVLSLKGFDYQGVLDIGAQGKLLGVKYVSDAEATHWFDPTMSALQAKVDALLSDTSNLLECGDCDQPTHLLVTSSSDRQPTAYQVYDVRKNAVEPLALSMPWIDPRQMAQRDMVRIAARDGLEFPVHVTRPVGAKGSTPAVVLVHGGPWVRGGHWEWRAESQFLASRGYTVIEPEFRGSAGYGNKLYTAGFRQWGLAMQDDLADAAQWAIKQGYADAKHICIAGGSYGGYATLMGLIRHPDIFRCGVEWAGVTDIDLMYSINWSDLSEEWKGFGMPVLIGDRERDAKQLAETSPIRQAARLKQPLLMAYGGVDRRVPIDHGKQMRSALSHNPDVEWIVYPDEGHGWQAEANQVDFWTRVEKFLDKHLKSAP